VGAGGGGSSSPCRRAHAAAVVVVALALTHAVLVVVLVDLGEPNEHVDREHGGAIAALHLHVPGHEAVVVES
jgi:hypothetical protein